MATLPQLAPATLTPKLTLDEYLHTIYHPDVDFVDDHTEERNLGELDHGTLQLAIGSWFFQHREEWNLRATVEYRTRTTSSRIRIPDISIMVNDRLRERVRTTPALICIEVLSPEDRIPRVKIRLQEFLDMGVPHVWVIDPERRIAYTFDPNGLHIVQGDRIELIESPIYLDLSEIFAALD